jgi:lipid II:glycine glycyltransferase (peptidoglycan interpeptide bridge formation enzyme)
MNIVPIEVEDRFKWNAFVAKEFPPVGAFLETWEWGEFKEKIHGKTFHFALVDGEDKDEWLACFHLEIHTVPFGLAYGYAPRGPVLKKELWNDEKKVAEVFTAISDLLKKRFSELVFVRFEPPHKESFPVYTQAPFERTVAYLQPRLNQLITLDTKGRLFNSFVSDVRHDIRAAERIPITVLETDSLTPEQDKAFEAMKSDTKKRSQKNIFPSDAYFKNLLESFKASAGASQEGQPSLRFFIAEKENTPVAIYLSVLFADTLTYLYGASYTGSISKRAPAYLHWKGISYADAHGLKYYDLGGVAEDAWHGLTYFKRQFGGETLEYIGTVNAVLRPRLYKLYLLARKYRCG